MKISDSHLSPEDLIDLLEGVRAETSVPHLSVCDRCRDQLTELRTAMSVARDADVPEPSPLFWTELSRRVTDAVSAEHIAQRKWFWWTRPRPYVPVFEVLALAAILFTVILNPMRRISDRSSPAASQATTVAALEDSVGDAADLDSDSSLSLVADLTAGMDLNAAIDAGLTSRDSAEHAVTHLNADELRALQRLLKEELARRGA